MKALFHTVDSSLLPVSGRLVAVFMLSAALDLGD